MQGACGVADAPARHRVGLGHAVDDDGALLKLGAERCDGHMLRAVVDQVLVNLVRDDGQVMADGDVSDGLQLLTGVDEAVGVVGGVEHDGARAVGDGGLDLLGRELEAVFLLRLHGHGHAARHDDQLGVADPVGAGDDHLVALVQQRLERVEQRMLRAVGHHDLLRLIGQPVVAQQLVAHGLSQLHHARCGRIARHAAVQCVLGGAADVLGRVKVRLACAKAHHVQAPGLHLLCLCVDLERQRARHSLAALGYPHHGNCIAFLQYMQPHCGSLYGSFPTPRGDRPQGR